jgi:hypothetical protein
MKPEQLNDIALDAIHSAAGALELRYRPAFYAAVADGIDGLESDALFTIREVCARAQRQVTKGTIG